jgi:hypothetical protein
VVCLECDDEDATMRRPWPTGGCYADKKNICMYIYSTREEVLKLISIKEVVIK